MIAPGLLRRGGVPGLPQSPSTASAQTTADESRRAMGGASEAERGQERHAQRAGSGIAASTDSRVVVWGQTDYRPLETENAPAGQVKRYRVAGAGRSEAIERGDLGAWAVFDAQTSTAAPDVELRLGAEEALQIVASDTGPARSPRRR